MASRRGLPAGQGVGVDADAGRLEPLGLVGQGVEQGRQGRGGLGAGRARGRRRDADQQRQQRDGGGRADAAAPERPGRTRRRRWGSHRQSLPCRGGRPSGAPACVQVHTLHAGGRSHTRRSGRGSAPGDGPATATGVDSNPMTPVAPTPPEPTDPPQAASPLRTRGFAWWLPLVVAAAAAAATFVLSERQEQVYESRAALIAPSGGVITPADLIDEIQADAVYEQTIRTLRLDTTVAALRERIDIAAAGVVIEVLARAPSAQEAQALARAFTSEARDPRLTNHGPLLDVYRAPLLPRHRTGGGTARNTAAATALGLVAGMGLALVAAGRERAAQPRLDVPALTGWPLLGALPRIAAPAGDVPPAPSPR